MVRVPIRTSDSEQYGRKRFCDYVLDDGNEFLETKYGGRILMMRYEEFEKEIQEARKTG